MKHPVLVAMLVLACTSTGACTSDKVPVSERPPIDDAASSADPPVAEELDACPPTTGESRTPSRTELENMEVQSLVVCRQTSPSTGDPNRDRYKLEKVVRVASAEGTQIVKLLAHGERVGAARCQLIDSPPPVMDMVQITDETGSVWSVHVPQPDCIGYRLAGSPALQELSVSGAIGDVLDPPATS